MRFSLLAVALLACSREQAPRPTASASATAEPSASASVAAPRIVLSATVASRDLPPFPTQEKAVSAAEAERLLAATEGARISVLDAGAEPRTIRRHVLRGGETHRLTIDIDLAMRVRQADETTLPPVPALTVGVDLRAVDATDDLATIQISVTRAEVRSRAEADAHVARDMEPLVAKLPGLTATLRLSAQGVCAESPEAPSETPKELLQLWSTVVEAVHDAIVVMPTEPIGKGARWTVIDRRRRAGVTMLRKTELTLKSVSDSELQLSGALTELAVAGTAHDPALPEEMALSVESGIAVGQRRIKLRPGQIWPLESITELSSDVVISATLKVGSGDTRTSKVEITQVLKSIRPD